MSDRTFSQILATEKKGIATKTTPPPCPGSNSTTCTGSFNLDDHLQSTTLGFIILIYRSALYCICHSVLGRILLTLSRIQLSSHPSDVSY